MFKVLSTSSFKYLSCKSDFSIRPVHFFKGKQSSHRSQPIHPSRILFDELCMFSLKVFFSWMSPLTYRFSSLFCWWYESHQFSCHAKHVLPLCSSVSLNDPYFITHFLSLSLLSPPLSFLPFQPL
jgi:hypothetical protein